MFRYKWKQKIIFFQICSKPPRVVTARVAVFDVSPRRLLSNFKYRCSFGSAWPVLLRYWWIEFFGSQRHIKKDATFFAPKHWNRFFLNLKQKIIPLRVPKKHQRLCRKSRRIEWFPSWPPSFFGWTISLSKWLCQAVSSTKYSKWQSQL
jgi:hypothetical protein